MLAGSFGLGLAFVIGAASTGGAAAPLTITWDADMRADAREGGYADTLKAYVEEARAEVARVMGLPVPTLRVVVHTAETYARRFGEAASSTWAAHYQGGAIYVNGSAPVNRAVVYHETTHAVLDQGKGRPPRWLNEGLAEYFSYAARGWRGIDSVQRLELTQGAADRRLTSLSSMPAMLDGLQYLTCYAAVSYLVERHGQPKVLGMVREVLDGTPLDTALAHLGAGSTSQLEAAFLAWVQH